MACRAGEVVGLHLNRHAASQLLPGNIPPAHSLGLKHTQLVLWAVELLTLPLIL